MGILYSILLHNNKSIGSMPMLCVCYQLLNCNFP
nr:MAG TPA: hypothetical protein [Caudoviricetes sp.]DAV02490.1 MAG TPA: hypothetical protein [Caudoviricetes sp.]DAY55517.1 MAG TPA: hypothetical protein [Caudoviricetes sp.]